MTELGLILGFVTTLLAAVLAVVFLRGPWDLLALLVIGGSLGYLVGDLVTYLRSDTPR